MKAEDWLRLVLTHEYAHILQLDMNGGLPPPFAGFLAGSLCSQPLMYFSPLPILKGSPSMRRRQIPEAGGEQTLILICISAPPSLRIQSPPSARCWVHMIWMNGSRQGPFIFMAGRWWIISPGSMGRGAAEGE